MNSDNVGPSPTDTLSVLTHTHNRVTKTWKADGTIAAFDDAKYYRLQQHTINGIDELSYLLTGLQSDPKSCLIRGVPVPRETAAQRDGEQYKPGYVRKALDYFDDQPLHAVMIDVDGYEPFAWDAITHTGDAIREFITTQLPEEWHGASYHWHVSSSFGHPTKLDTGLRVHLWFWLDQPLTSAQLKAYAKATKLAADVALFNPVQAHFTADPFIEDGVEDPITDRWGYVHGAPSVTLTGEIPTVSATASSAGQRMLDIANDDPIVARLDELGLIKTKTRDGYNIECPFDEDHSGPSAETSTQYRLPYTNGHALGQFICLHAHCSERPRMEYMDKLGLVNTLADFEDLSALPEVVLDKEIAESIAKVKEERFKLYTTEEFVVRSKATWLIKGVLPWANFGVFYGASGSGKSFFVFNMAAAIARGIAWRGHKTTKARVLWIAAEGQEDMRKRVYGYCMAEGIDPKDLDMKFIDSAPNLMDVADVKALIKKIKEQGEFDLIVIDTLAQVMAGGNENSGEDMGKVMGHCKQITRHTGAMVAPVHHSGKDESRGARGWSGLRAACDFEYEIIRAGEDRVATVTKMKGGADGEEFGFRLETIIVGKDDDQDDETTCVIQFTDASRADVAAQVQPGGNSQKEILKQAGTMLGLGDGIVTRNALVAAVAATRPRGDSERDQRVSNVNRDTKKLIDNGFLLESSTGLITLPSKRTV
ncbi:AAA domain containing protein [uncultured Caudovirales phage]|uniref:AAA domain containing protein n=1 Tax=uncultured Caudovirales phage TaxID=2100421 RepID=A0A6J5T8J5_9CAUD|nr:AAA domain containing protein [uncultured Caudovirales phage]